MFGPNVIEVLAPDLVMLAPVLLIWVITRERLSIAVVRRLYVYATAFLGLQLTAVGSRDILSMLLERVSANAVGTPREEVQRLSLAVALLIVGGPLWGFHWYFAQKSVDRSEERYSPVRRLYGYAVLTVLMLVLLFSIQDLIGGTLRPPEFALTPGWIPRAIASLLIYGVIWAYHWRVMAADRVVVEVADASATLRRWYLVVIQGFGLATAALAAANLISQLLRVWLVPAIGQAPPLGWMVARLMAGLAVWLPHHLWARRLVRRSGPLREDEAWSPLRQGYEAVVIILTAAAALGAAASLLRAILLAMFSGTGWISVLEDYTPAIATILVALPIWAYHRRQLTEEALLADIPARQDTARRVIWYLTAAVGLAALFFGFGGLVYALLQMLLPSNAIGAGWSEPLSTYLALSSVALPIYAGSRILIPTDVAGYELVGVRANPKALARDAARLVRERLVRGTEGSSTHPSMRHQNSPLGRSRGIERK